MPGYVPDRNDIVRLDIEPTKHTEIGKHRTALVLSGKDYNKVTGLLICCPISSSIRNAPTEVWIDNLDSPSVVASNLITTLDWRIRKVKKIANAENGVFENVILRVIPLIGADRVVRSLTDG